MAIDNTELDVLIPERWSSDLLAGLYQAADIIGRVQNVSGDVAAFGDILHLPLMAQWSVNDVTASRHAVTGPVFFGDDDTEGVGGSECPEEWSPGQGPDDQSRSDEQHCCHDDDHHKFDHVVLRAFWALLKLCRHSVSTVEVV